MKQIQHTMRKPLRAQSCIILQMPICVGLRDLSPLHVDQAYVKACVLQVTCAQTMVTLNELVWGLCMCVSQGLSPPGLMTSSAENSTKNDKPKHGEACVQAVRVAADAVLGKLPSHLAGGSSFASGCRSPQGFAAIIVFSWWWGSVSCGGWILRCLCLPTF